MRADPTRVLAVAHRAGNDLGHLRAALDLGVDVVEADVHSSRGRLEVRHSKVLGPVLWDRRPWTVTRRRRGLELDALVAALDSHAAVMLDLKGVGPVGRHVLAALTAARPAGQVLVCSRWWPAAGRVRRRGLGAARARRARPRRAGPAAAAAADGPRRRTASPLHGSLLSAPVVAELRGRVERVMTWGVDDLDALERVTALGVNGVISDSAGGAAGAR